MRDLVRVGLVGISPSHEPTAADIRLTDRLVRLTSWLGQMLSDQKQPPQPTAFISVDRPTVWDGIARLSEWVSEWILTEQDRAGPRTKAATNEHPKQWHLNISGLVDRRSTRTASGQRSPNGTAAGSR